MIVTLTANPSLDRTIVLEAPLRPGQVQSALEAREDAGGKGINVARVVAAADVPTMAVLPLDEADPYVGALRATRVPNRAVLVAGNARANVTITDPAGVTTKLNLPGTQLTEEECEKVVAAVVDECEGAGWLALAGSLPPGVSDDFYVDVILAVRERWGDKAPRIAVDTSGAALAAAVERGYPDLIKPNDEELAELAGVEIPDRDEHIEAVLPIARRLVPDSVGAALVTLGARGAVLVTADGAWAATPPAIQVVSTVGAGDSSLAGYLLADLEGASPEERLVRSMLYGAAAASLAGTQAPTPHQLPTGEVHTTPLS